MTPGAHLLASWLVGEGLGLEQRERRLVALAGVIPDLDGAGLLVDIANNFRHHPTFFYDDFHHGLGHNLFFGLFIAILVRVLARRRRPAALLGALLACHLHLLGDLAGSLGPDGYHWPISYLYPCSTWATFSWSGQWALNGWQNNTIFALLFMAAFFVAARRRYSFIEFFSPMLDQAFFALVNRRWPIAG